MTHSEFIKKLERNDFYRPSKAAVAGLVPLLEEKRQRYLEESLKDEEEIDFPEDIRQQIEASFSEEEASPLGEESSQEEKIRSIRDFVREQLYYQFGFLAADTVGNRNPIDFRDFVSGVLSRLLDLPKETISFVTISDEVNEWLENKSEYVSPYWTIFYANGGGFYLVLKSEEQEDTSERHEESQSRSEGFFQALIHSISRAISTTGRKKPAGIVMMKKYTLSDIPPVQPIESKKHLQAAGGIRKSA